MNSKNDVGVLAELLRIDATTMSCLTLLSVKEYRDRPGIGNPRHSSNRAEERIHIEIAWRWPRPPAELQSLFSRKCTLHGYER